MNVRCSASTGLSGTGIVVTFTYNYTNYGYELHVQYSALTSKVLGLWSYPLGWPQESTHYFYYLLVSITIPIPHAYQQRSGVVFVSTMNTLCNASTRLSCTSIVLMFSILTTDMNCMSSTPRSLAACWTCGNIP